MARALQIFKRKLTNLSSANPNLWIRRLKADIHLDLTDSENAIGFSAWKLFDDLFADKHRIPLIPIADPRNSDTNLLSQKLHSLVRKQQLVVQERGVDQLFLAFGFVLGCWPDGSWVRTPLVYFPCNLSHNQKIWSLELDPAEAFINPAFLLAYAFHFKQDVESSLFEKDLDLEASDGLSFLTALYQKLKESHLEIHFNQALFEQKIQAFPPITKETLPTGFEPGKLKLQPNAVLGLFPQSDSVLISDFEYLEQYQLDLESIFLKHLPVNQIVLEKNLYCPLPMDGSQEDCIRKVKAGQSLVVQGPPGTGKSQLISNVMADAIGMGKSVLLVCQKRVALEVVLNRLKEVGISDFVGLWSDYKKDREPLFAQLAAQIDRLEEVEKASKKLDTVVIERQFVFASQTIDQISQSLEDWRAAFFDIQAAGLSINELYSRKIKHKLFDFEGKLITQFKWDEWQQFSVWFSRNWSFFLATLHSDFLLKDRKNWALMPAPDFDHIPSVWKNLADQSKAIFTGMQSRGLSVDRPNWDEDLCILSDSRPVFLAAEEHIRTNGLDFLFHFPPLKWIVKSEWQKLESILDSLFASQNQLANWPGSFTLSLSQIEKYRRNIDVWKKHSQVKVWWNILSLTRSEVFELKVVAKKLGLSFHQPDQLDQVLDQARNHILLSQELSIQQADEISLERIQKTAEYQHAFKLEAENIQLVKNATATVIQISNQTEWTWNRIEEMLEWGDSLKIKGEKNRRDLEAYFDSESGKKLPVQFTEVENWIECFTTRKEEIRLADKAKTDVPETWLQLLDQILKNDRLVSKPKGELLECLEDYWTQAWVANIESQFPAMKQVGTMEWEEELQLLRQKIAEKQSLVAQILQQKLRENTYKDLEHNRLRNRTTYRDLYHQVTKKRQRWPMRQVWEQSGEEILKLIPAWLATPESVSATWPMEMRFDLVIFDEASQCFAEKGLPSAFRGRQLLVIGDDKQLPPNHLFASRWDEDGEEDATFSEQDSLLDLAKQFLPQAMLRSHYRSLYPELIEFSNQHFYQNKLECIPLPVVYQNRVSVFKYEKVDGVWHNQQNEIEAIRLCELVLLHLQTSKSESVGIITFNQKQQVLIEKILDQMADEAGILLPESLFVKNIENVQGDERDHIWFSVAYAKNEQGKVISQFGSLSQAGGENRLNVAVSRAKKSITLVTSILPHELPVSDSAALGSALLRQYLEFVYHKAQGIGEQNGRSRLNSQNHIELSLPFSDSAQLDADGGILLRFNDDERLYSSPSMKDFFGFKYLMFTQKGYSIHYYFKRKNWVAQTQTLEA